VFFSDPTATDNQGHEDRDFQRSSRHALFSRLNTALTPKRVRFMAGIVDDILTHSLPSGHLEAAFLEALPLVQRWSDRLQPQTNTDRIK
jgi:hypothetical protein